MATNLQNLEKFLNMMDQDVLTKEEFKKVFEKVINFVLQIQQKQADSIEELTQKHNNLISEIKAGYAVNLSDLKNQVNDLFVRDQLKKIDNETKVSFDKLQIFINSMIEKKIKDIDGRLAMIRDGAPGKRGEQGSPDTAKEILEKLSISKIPLNFITGLDEKFNEFLNKIGKLPLGRGGSVVNSVLVEDLTSQVNSVLTEFTVPRHRFALLCLSSQFPFIYRPTTDFTTANRTLTLVTSQVAVPVSGQTLIFLYVK